MARGRKAARRGGLGAPGQIRGSGCERGELWGGRGGGSEPLRRRIPRRRNRLLSSSLRSREESPGDSGSFGKGRGAAGGTHRAQGLPSVPNLTFSPSLRPAAAAVLNATIQAPVQPAQPLQAAGQPRPPLQPPGVFPAVPSQPPILPQPTAPTPPAAKPLETQTQTQIAVQPAGFAFNAGIVRSPAARRVEFDARSPLPGAARPRGRSPLAQPSSPGGSCEIPASVSPSPATDE